MLKPTCLITWPVHADFPLFRHNLRRYRQYFEDIFIAFTNENQLINYRLWVTEHIPFAQFTKPFHNKVDWRNDTVNALLTLKTNATHYLFFEQDFLISGNEFFERVFSSDKDFIYYEEGGRIHPSFALVSRELIEKTSKDFSAYPDEGMDHFGKFFKEVQAINKGTNILELGVMERIHFYHLAGLTQNYYCADHDQPLYKPMEFLSYNLLSMLLPYQNQSFYKRSLIIAEKFGYEEEQPTFLDKFFPEPIP